MQALSKRFGVNVEEIQNGRFPRFLKNVEKERVLLLCDKTTFPFSEQVYNALKENDVDCARYTIPEEEPVADEKTVQSVVNAADKFDYILAVGAGTLNDLAKRAGFLTHKKSGVFATAPSMDGYTSGVTPLIENGFKITRNAQVASDILLDYSVLTKAPSIMLGAGVGDILAKYCCLTDWKMSALLTGEDYNDEAANLMYEAVRACDESIPSLMRREEKGVRRLMEALIISGYAMVIAGSSRPASGAEHHMSHFLEMDFLKRGERIPLHGIKVGLGTAVSLYLYHTLKNRPSFEGCEKVYNLAEKLPTSEFVLNILGKLGCPTSFSALGVSKATVKDMLLNAYKIRDRFTILTLYCQKGFINDCLDELLKEFY